MCLTSKSMLQGKNKINSIGRKINLISDNLKGKINKRCTLNKVKFETIHGILVKKSIDSISIKMRIDNMQYI